MGNDCAPEVAKVIPNYKTIKKSFTDIKQPLKRKISGVIDKISLESKIIKTFEKSILNKELIIGMSIIDRYYNDIDFSKHYFPNGDTPIHYAVRLHNINFLFFLLQKGYNVNVTNELTNDTPIHIATKHSDIVMVGILLKFNCDVNVPNILGKTPIDIAYKNNDYEVLYMLNEFRQKLNKTDTISSQSPLSVDTNRNPRTTLTFSMNDIIDDDIDDDIDDGTILLSAYEGYDGKEMIRSPVPVSGENSLQLNNEFNLLSPRTPTLTESGVSLNGIPNKSVHIIRNCFRDLDERIFSLSDWMFRLRIVKDEPKLYQKRYLFVRNCHLIWHSKKVIFDENSNIDGNILSDYDGFIHLFLIKNVCVYKSKKNSEYKFVVHTHTYNVKDKSQNPGIHIFKCDSKSKRDQWVYQLNEYSSFLSNIMTTLHKCDI